MKGTSSHLIIFLFVITTWWIQTKKIMHNKWMLSLASVEKHLHIYVTLQNKTLKNDLIEWTTNEAIVQTYSESSFVSSACSFSLSECSLDRYCLIMSSSTCVIVYFLKARYCMKNKKEKEENSKREMRKRNTEKIGAITNTQIV